MRTRRFGWLAAVVISISAVAGCTAYPTEEPIYNVAPEHCPYTPEVVQFNGDSLGAGISRQVDLPGYSKFEASQGSAGWTFQGRFAPIGERVKEWIDQCGVPGALMIQGGIIDLVIGVPVEKIKAAVLELSDWLEARGVPTVWVGFSPFPAVSDYSRYFTPARIAFNDWLATPGNVWGTGVDCTPAVSDPWAPEVLAPRFWKIVDIFGNPDGLHPNKDGYVALADCAEPHLLAALGAT